MGGTKYWSNVGYFGKSVSKSIGNITIPHFKNSTDAHIQFFCYSNSAPSVLQTPQTMTLRTDQEDTDHEHSGVWRTKYSNKLQQSQLKTIGEEKCVIATLLRTKLRIPHWMNEHHC